MTAEDEDQPVSADLRAESASLAEDLRAHGFETLNLTREQE